MGRIYIKHGKILGSFIVISLAFLCMFSFALLCALIMALAYYNKSLEFNNVIVITNISKILFGMLTLILGFYIFLKSYYEIDDNYVRLTESKIRRIKFMTLSHEYRNNVLMQYMLLALMTMLIIFGSIDAFVVKFNGISLIMLFDFIFNIIYFIASIIYLHSIIQKRKEIEEKFYKKFRVVDSNNEE